MGNLRLGWEFLKNYNGPLSWMREILENYNGSLSWMREFRENYNGSDHVGR